MPLLKKKTFEKVPPQEFLRDDEEVFYCELTNEIFRNYEEFAERMLLCTSMVWTCAMTGKSNLTYEEALESEENARKTISEFPVELRIPVLYVATKTKRTGFGEMAEDVFFYCKDRYFIGEKLESCFTGNKWVESHVLQVISPSESKCEKQNGSPDKHSFPSPSSYKYEIEHLDADDQDISEIMIVDHNQLRRRKALFSREKCKLFLKQHVQQDANMHWIIKPSAIKEFGIDKIKFENIFSGPEPAFDPSKRYEKKLESAPSLNGKKSRQETLAKYLTKLDVPQKMNGTTGTLKKSKESEENNVQLLEEIKRKREEFIKSKLLKEEEQKWVALQMKAWNQHKEDLELVDQKILPDVPALRTAIPDKYIGDVLMLMEFISKFSDLLNPKNFVQCQITIKLMERALLEAEVAGPLTDLIQMFLSAIMTQQGDEHPCRATFLKTIDVSNMSIEDATKFATLAAHWPKTCQGLHLKELPLYSLTVSEVLRLHLLSSGAKLPESGEKKRYYLRGGYCGSDDPGLWLRMNKPHIIKELAFKTVTQLKLEDKIEILTCLMYQLLTYANCRETVEEGREQSLQAKYKVKTLLKDLRKNDIDFTASMNQLKRKIKKEDITKEMETLKMEDSHRKSKIVEDLEENTKLIHDDETFLGADRAYRKYFKLGSVPGVFVDSTEDNPGQCQQEKVRQYPELIDAEKSVISKYLETNFHSLKKEKSTDDTAVENGTTEVPVTNGTAEGGGEDHDSLMMCNADADTCKVHSDMREQRKWMVVNEPKTLDDFVAALNKRGVREGELSDSIKYDRDRLETAVQKTPSHLWGVEDDSQTMTRGKNPYIEANFGFPPGTPIDEILQSTLTDDILELEQKLYTGGLGQLRVKNRNNWREALSNKDYENFDREINRRAFLETDAECGKEDDDASEEALDVKIRFADQDPGNFLGTIKEEVEEPSGPMKEAMECLAIALVQVAHSIEPKFLRKPIGNSDPKKLFTFVPSKNNLEKWEKSLLSSTSFSQIFLHYGTLDASIMWSRSVSLASCKLCRGKKDSVNMLLCDNCNGGFHMYCLKPKLKAIPRGEWFCKKCESLLEREERHVLSEVLPKKKQRIFKEENDPGEEAFSNGNSHVNSEPMNVDLCNACNSGGILISCEECRTFYHMECAEPRPSRTKQNWVCSECKDNSEFNQEEASVQNNNDRGKRRTRRGDKETKKYEESEDSDSGDSTKNTTKRKRSFRRECGRDDLPLHNAALQDLLQEIMKHPDAWPFLRPVKNYEVPDYHELISHPMDFGTIKYKLNMGEYQTDSQVMNDAVLVFHNCNIYNEVNSEIHRCGQTILKVFRTKCEELGFELPSKLAEEEVSDAKRRRKLY